MSISVIQVKYILCPESSGLSSLCLILPDSVGDVETTGSESILDSLAIWWQISSGVLYIWASKVSYASYFRGLQSITDSRADLPCVEVVGLVQMLFRVFLELNMLLTVRHSRHASSFLLRLFQKSVVRAASSRYSRKSRL